MSYRPPVTFSLYFGKSLQLIALASVAAGLFLGVHDRDMWTELLFFLSGITLFGLGSWILKHQP
jgi:hypothetical protein